MVDPITTAIEFLAIKFGGGIASTAFLYAPQIASAVVFATTAAGGAQMQRRSSTSS